MITLSEMNESVSFSLKLSTGKLPAEIYDIPIKIELYFMAEIELSPWRCYRGKCNYIMQTLEWTHVLMDAHMYFHSSCFVLISFLYLLSFPDTSNI